ncbi:hypothetical protein L2E82_24911 [Cichorium intybus]|uniref:Uncharacterized protein n=1 Tax=Cichorium intybus TaxID=13427 RepID=A0ACB9E2C2_CICIN|nr:hypothetical protein L2E82_24911 [Cichorium intybus]
MDLINESIDIIVDKRVFSICVKEIEGRFLDHEKEFEVKNAEREELGDSSEDDEGRDLSDNEPPERISDEDFDEDYDESIIRESSPEVEGHAGRRNEIIDETNHAFLIFNDSKEIKEKVNEDTPQSKYCVVGCHPVITFSPNTCCWDPRKSDKGKEINHRKEARDNHSEEGPHEENRSSFIQLGVSPNKNIILSEHITDENEIKDGQKVDLSEKMKFLLDRNTPMGNKLKILDEEEAYTRTDTLEKANIAQEVKETKPSNP